MGNEASDTRSSTNPTVVMMLNSLTEVCHNAHDGYMEAANAINSAAYRTMFAEYALQRRRFASQLANLVRDLGGEPDDDGVHDSWRNIRAVLMGGDHGAIFQEIEQAEDAAINTYEQALDSENVPETVYKVVDEQYGLIVEACDRMRGLRTAYRQRSK